MTRFGGARTQLYDQDSAQGYLPTATWAGGANTTQPNSGQYSILNLIDDFEGTAPGFDFFIDWPAPPPGITFTYIWWSQSLNPFDGRGTVNLFPRLPSLRLGAAPASADWGRMEMDPLRWTAMPLRSVGGGRLVPPLHGWVAFQPT